MIDDRLKILKNHGKQFRLFNANDEIRFFEKMKKEIEE
jgi:hypothetical protein